MVKPTILLVDDEPLNVELLEGSLSDDYRILKAYSGTDALIMARKNLPDLILLDIMMPDINGYEVCSQLKIDEKTRYIPIVMITILKEKPDRIKAMEAGADDFLSKPVDVYELTVRVKSLIRIKQYYDALMEEQVKLYSFKSALDSMDDCVIITNLNGNINYVNLAFEKQFGYSVDEINGGYIGKINHPDSTLSLDKDSLIKATNHEWKGNMVAINKQGLSFNMGIKCSPVVKDTRQINLVFVLREN